MSSEHAGLRSPFCAMKERLISAPMATATGMMIDRSPVWLADAPVTAEVSSCSLPDDDTFASLFPRGLIIKAVGRRPSRCVVFAHAVCGRTLARG